MSALVQRVIDVDNLLALPRSGKILYGLSRLVNPTVLHYLSIFHLGNLSCCIPFKQISTDFFALRFLDYEAILVLNILSGVIFGATSHSRPQYGIQITPSNRSLDGLQSLDQLLSSISVTILFTIIVITLVLRNRLNAKLIQE